MRLLHTSDWHLGRAFHGGPLQREQEAVIDQLVDMAGADAVDVVIVAGDIFDRAIPPLEAVQLFDDAVGRLRGTGARVVAISGNHDSPRRVAVHDRLLAHAGVTIRGDAARCDEAVMIEATDGGGPVAVYAVPYLDPSTAAAVLAEPPAGDEIDEPAPRRRLSHDAVTRLATARIRVDRAARPGGRTVVVAHTFVAGGASSESERDLTIGTVEMVGLDAFDGFDYVALGHLHRPQAFADGRIAYSGSPLPYSFSEQSHHKSARLVELSADGSIGVELRPLDVGMRLATITGDIDVLLADPSLGGAETARVRAVLTDIQLPVQAMARLRSRFPLAVELRHAPTGGHDSAPAGPSGATGRDVPPLELATRFWSETHPTGATVGEEALLAEALAAASRTEEQ